MFTEADKWLFKILGVWLVISVLGFIKIWIMSGVQAWFLLTSPLGILFGWAVVNLIEGFKK